MLLSCGGGGGGGSDESPVVEIASTNEPKGIIGSEVFIDGRSVTLWATWCCDHEVTQKEFETDCPVNDMGLIPSAWGVGDNYPAYYVNWYEAITYCNKRSIREGLTPCYTVNGVDFSGEVTVPSDENETWNEAECDFTANGYRLPTEAEWEYFARGGNLTNSGQTTYSGSDNIDSVAWYSSNSSSATHEVKEKESNGLNLYDMSGNVREWCWDWYSDIEQDTPSSGAPSGSFRVLRGGCRDCPASHCSVAGRYGYVPHFGALQFFGFRVVRTAN